MIDALAVIFAALIAVGSIAGMAIIAGRAWARSKCHDEPEHLAGEAEADRRKTTIALRDKTFCI